MDMSFLLKCSILKSYEITQNNDGNSNIKTQNKAVELVHNQFKTKKQRLSVTTTACPYMELKMPEGLIETVELIKRKITTIARKKTYFLAAERYREL